MPVRRTPDPPSTITVRSSDDFTKEPSSSAARKNASNACAQCRKKRVRCHFETSDDNSCSMCKRMKTKCRIEPNADMRCRRHRLQIQQDQQSLHQFLDFLSGNEEPENLLKMLKDHMPATELVERLDTLKKLVSAQTVDSAKDSSSMSTVDFTPPTSPSCTVDPAKPSPPVMSSRQASDASREEDQTGGTRPRSVGREKHIAPGAVRSFGNLATTDSIMTNGYPSNVQRQQIRAITGSLATCIPLNITAGTGGVADATARAMMSFRETARSMIANGAPVRTVLSMDGVPLDLFFRDRVPSDPHTLSTWACEFAKAWSSTLPLPLCLAAIHYVSSLMRWLILPCPETYACVSPLLRPTTSQLMLPHTLDIDLCHLPMVRDHQLNHGGRWIEKVSADSQRLSWPPGEEMWVEKSLLATDNANTDGATKVRYLSPRFIEFINDINNWSIHHAMLKEVPDLASCVRLHTDGIDTDDTARVNGE